MKRISLMLAALLIVGCGSASFESKLQGDGSAVAPEQPSENGSPAPRIPIDRILQDPTLLDMYPCVDGTSTGVELCHYPESEGSHHTICIGRSAVYTHVDHIRSETDFDYLGPCQD
ncbi:MAG TPA: hypothetical protein VFV50_14560 [Bdellovibrionales bacterium]|nr:hypothetical protein [Bdellovibrionales bacterium]